MSPYLRPRCCPQRRLSGRRHPALGPRLGPFRRVCAPSAGRAPSVWERAGEEAGPGEGAGKRGLEPGLDETDRLKPTRLGDARVPCSSEGWG